MDTADYGSLDPLMLTTADEMAFIGMLRTCGARHPHSGDECNRAVGHIGDHVALAYWPRESHTVRIIDDQED